MFETLAETKRDDETPSILRDIFQIFVDASPLAPMPVPFATLASRMARMAKTQRDAGHTYFAAISLHNAAIAALAAGNVRDAVRLAEEALGAFDALTFPASERYSAYVLLATCAFEGGDSRRGEEYLELALGSGHEHADVHADAALLFAAVGNRERADSLLFSADALEKNGLSDLHATTTATLARALLSLPADPERALALLDRIPRERPLDVGGSLAREVVEATAYLLWDDDKEALKLAQASLNKVAAWAALGARARLSLVAAAAANDGQRLANAIADAGSVGELALLEMADVVGSRVHLLAAVPPALTASISKWPHRWLPVLRHELQRGPTASSRAAAELLDVHGTVADVIRLRAYAKTYGIRNRIRPSLGRELARRVAPPLHIHDLGRGVLQVGPRETILSAIRRKPASLLMYLVTRPDLTATREQVLDQLWPDSDPVSGNNSLNQSLYFLRREVDPWYEDDVSVDYIRLQGDLVWLERGLTRIESVVFVRSVQAIDWREPDIDDLRRLVRSYRGSFAPEFEYEEWAIAWRTRAHAAFLSLANSAIDVFAAAGRGTEARDVAVQVLDVDPDATEIEAKLIRLYWQLGARSAAAAQYAHLESQSRADGIDPPSFTELTVP
jgi:DNA-binding SARP family transcriptional activator